MRWPDSARSMPRRVVSTSGNSGTATARLLDLGFLVRDVLAHERVELAHFHLVRMQALVLHRAVEMTGTGRREQFDFLAHGRPPLISDLDAAIAHSGQHRLQALLLDRAHGVGRDAQCHPARLALEPEALRVQIGQKTPTRAIVRMRDGIAAGGAFARDLTDARHGGWILAKGSLYTSRRGLTASGGAAPEGAAAPEAAASVICAVPSEGLLGARGRPCQSTSATPSNTRPAASK